jgi:hypothetical protein
MPDCSLVIVAFSCVRINSEELFLATPPSAPFQSRSFGFSGGRVGLSCNCHRWSGQRLAVEGRVMEVIGVIDSVAQKQ